MAMSRRGSPGGTFTDGLASMVLASMLLALASLAAAAPAAAARPRVPRAAREAVPDLRDKPGAPACVPDCPNDRSPCDPPAFKHADARCNRNI